jgi:hypothetical protein
MSSKKLDVDGEEDGGGGISTPYRFTIGSGDASCRGLLLHSNHVERTGACLQACLRVSGAVGFLRGGEVSGFKQSRGEGSLGKLPNTRRLSLFIVYFTPQLLGGMTAECSLKNNTQGLRGVGRAPGSGEGSGEWGGLHRCHTHIPCDSFIHTHTHTRAICTTSSSTHPHTSIPSLVRPPAPPHPLSYSTQQLVRGLLSLVRGLFSFPHLCL